LGCCPFETKEFCAEESWEFIQRVNEPKEIEKNKRGVGSDGRIRIWVVPHVKQKYFGLRCPENSFREWGNAGKT
jgi:hypothetical protein